MTWLLTDRISIGFMAVGVKESFPGVCLEQGERWASLPQDFIGSCVVYELCRVLFFLTLRA